MWFIATRRSEFRLEFKEKPDQHCCMWHCLLLQQLKLLIFISLCWPLYLHKKVIKKFQQCWYRLSTKKGLFQEKQELYTWTLLMKNRKLEIFLRLILGSKGKLLPKQKTQQIFSLPATPLTLNKDTTELGLASKQGTGRWLVAVPSKKSTNSVFSMAFPSADVPAVCFRVI